MPYRIATVGVLLVALLLAAPQATRGQVSPDVIEQVIARTVFLALITPVGDGKFRQFGGCSGAFITPTGYILTASHCVRATEDHTELRLRKGELHNPDGLVPVAVNVPGQARPVMMMLAKLVADSVPLDLALIKVERMLGSGGVAPLPADFRVPFLQLGDSESLRHGEPVAVVGFPGVGGETVSANLGNVAGFAADDQNRKTWLKLDASGAGPGSSGGPVVNGRGEEVGVISHGIVNPQARSVRAMMVTRMPAEWKQAMAGTGPAGGAIPPRPADDVAVLQGRIVDAGNGAPIRGAGVFILRQGANPRSATRDDVLAASVTDANGVFQTKPPVRRGQTYPIAILADGYQSVFGSIEVPAGSGDVVTVRPVQMQR
jgi:S1-C subfamily serine protease